MPYMAAKQRVSIQTYVTAETKAAVEALAQRTGMSQAELFTRVFAWLAAQNEVVQFGVLGLIPASVASEVAEMVLRRIAAHEAPRSKKAS